MADNIITRYNRKGIAYNSYNGLLKYGAKGQWLAPVEFWQQFEHSDRRKIRKLLRANGYSALAASPSHTRNIYAIHPEHPAPYVRFDYIEIRPNGTTRIVGRNYRGEPDMVTTVSFYLEFIKEGRWRRVTQTEAFSRFGVVE